MKNLQVSALFHLTICFSIFVHALCHVEILESCLIDRSVFNFSLYPHSTYFSLLDFSIQNLRLADPSAPKPVAIIMPDSKQQLIDTVLCCRKGIWEIRVRSGGHSYEGSSYIADDGSSFVLIDMMNLNQVSVEIESEVAWVEGGATLGQTYYAISEASPVHGFPAGSCPTVGIGGHVAGGGFGLLSRKYGLAADNVVDALLIDSKGRLLNRAAMGEEVFWAIRGGGGGNWGVVYAWKLRLSSVPRTVTSFTVSKPGSRHHVLRLLEKWQHVAPGLEEEFYLSAFVGAALPGAKGTGISATFKGFYLGHKTEVVTILSSAFPELEIRLDDCVEMSWIDSILYFSGLNNGSTIASLKERFFEDKHYFKAKSDYVRSPISRSGLASAIAILEKEAKGYVILDPYGGAMHQISSESIPFPHRKGNLFTIQYLVEWKEEENGKSQDYIDWIRGFYGAMGPHVSSDPRAAYINYEDFDLGVMGVTNSNVQTSSDAVEVARIWGEKYFLKNYDRLVRAKTIIDPTNVFRNQQGIPPMSNTSQWKAQM